MSPKYKHDCESCRFLGTFFEFDVYLCHQSIIARYGDDGPEYASSMISILLDQFTNPNYRMGLSDSKSMAMQEWLFSNDVCGYYKAWLLALATLQIKELTQF